MSQDGSLTMLPPRLILVGVLYQDRSFLSTLKRGDIGYGFLARLELDEQFAELGGVFARRKVTYAREGRVN